jgi:hypothetical protein
VVAESHGQVQRRRARQEIVHLTNKKRNFQILNMDFFKNRSRCNISYAVSSFQKSLKISS